MPLRKLSKLIFASAMKSTWNEEKQLKQQKTILNGWISGNHRCVCLQHSMLMGHDGQE